MKMIDEEDANVPTILEVTLEEVTQLIILLTSQVCTVLTRHDTVVLLRDLKDLLKEPNKEVFVRDSRDMYYIRRG